MNRMVNKIFRLGIATKLVVLFAIFGIVPMAAVGYLGASATGEMETAAGLRVQAMAETIGDKIDRNLFERYGDPQSFGLNRIVGERYHWYSKENNAIASAMNQYVATSGIYYLTILVDPAGDVMAVNSKDAKGNPIDTTAIYSKKYTDAPWFKAVEAKEFTTRQPFTSSGNATATGTYIEDVHVDEDVKSVYLGDDGLTLPALSIGAKGVVSVVSNLAPKLCSDLIKAWDANERAEAQRLHVALQPLIDACFMESSPTPVKYGLSLLGIGDGSLRLPLAEAESATRERVAHLMSELGLLN